MRAPFLPANVVVVTAVVVDGHQLPIMEKRYAAKAFSL